MRGTKSIPLHDPETVRKKAHEMFEGCFSKPGFKEWTPQGTPGVTPWVNEVGAFPTKNFWTTYFDHHPGIGGEALLERIWLTDKGCFCCPTPCGKYSLTKVNSKSAYVEGPEYETVALIGGNCMLRTIEEVAYGNYLCDELGQHHLRRQRGGFRPRVLRERSSPSRLPQGVRRHRLLRAPGARHRVP